VDLISDGSPDRIPVDEQSNDQIVHLLGLRKANRPAYQPLNPCPHIDVLALDPLHVWLPNAVVLCFYMALVGRIANICGGCFTVVDLIFDEYANHMLMAEKTHRIFLPLLQGGRSTGLEHHPHLDQGLGHACFARAIQKCTGRP
jgi:hypothetical protein